jgi:hypothetical protein
MSKEKDEKHQSGYVLGTELDGSGSFDNFSALVAEGRKTLQICVT